jgi:polysaccharide biosynthesis transport protein
MSVPDSPITPSNASATPRRRGEEHAPVRYLRALYKRRWTAVTVFLIISVSSAVLTLTETPLYEARTQILIEKESSNVISFKEAFEQNQIADDYYQTQYKILQSRALARRALDSADLWTEPAPARPRVGWLAPVRSMLSMIGGRVDAVFEITHNSKGPITSSESAARSARIDDFLSGLIVAPVRSSRLVELK